MNPIPNFENYPFEVKPLSPDGGRGYVIRFPDLPGCMSVGQTVEDAITNGRDAFQAWMESALADGALIICMFYPRLEPTTAERLSKIARVIFGICLIYFGLAHHFYLANTVRMVPAWLPPGQIFWAYATGAGHVAAGIAIISGVYARLGAVLLTAMFIIFTVLVHAPKVLSDPHNHFAWGENAVNFALIGSAWVVATSIPAVGKTKA